MTGDRRLGWLLLGSVAANVATLVLSCLFVLRVVHESEQRDCGTLAADIQGFRETPPTTPAGVNQLRVKLERFQQLDCERER